MSQRGIKHTYLCTGCISIDYWLSLKIFLPESQQELILTLTVWSQKGTKMVWKVLQYLKFPARSSNSETKSLCLKKPVWIQGSALSFKSHIFSSSHSINMKNLSFFQKEIVDKRRLLPLAMHQSLYIVSSSLTVWPPYFGLPTVDEVPNLTLNI